MALPMSRDETLARLAGPWDLVIVGGGITGAGLLREATRAGVKALLLERRDFAWGTSSRSSKLVHGGFRYLAQGRLRLVFDAVRERERLLAEAPGLVTRLGFLFPTYAGARPGRGALALGFAAYDLLGGAWRHRHLDAPQAAGGAPGLDARGLTGAFRFEDAQTDDARLVLRLLREACAAGGAALNHAPVTGLLRAAGRVRGVVVRAGAAEREVPARVVVNATGASGDVLRAELGARPRIRRLRGSHLVFPSARLPLGDALMLRHPEDRRYLFAIPWEGVTLFGTTDLDEKEGEDASPAMSREEARYLEAALARWFPSLGLRAGDALAATCGVRPVIGTGKANPSAESREHLILDEDGLLTVMGGKLTTFRLVAREALARAAGALPRLAAAGDVRVVDAVSMPAAVAALGAPRAERLLGRYGAEAEALVSGAAARELEEIPGTPILWAELAHAARREWVERLDDLLLRRVRLGLLLPDGGAEHLGRVSEICRSALGWDDACWETEEAAYRAEIARSWSVPV